MELDNKKLHIEISTNSVIKVLIVVLLLLIFYLIKDVIVILFFSFILVSLLEPAVTWLKNKKVPKVLAVLLLYLLMLSFVAGVVLLLIPPISHQTSQLAQSFPEYWQRLNYYLGNIGSALSQYGLSAPLADTIKDFDLGLPEAGLFAKLSDFVSNIFSLIVILVITFYLLVEENAFRRILHSLVPSHYLPYATQLFTKIQKKIGQWLRGQLILSFIIFVTVYVALLISGVKYALILAIVAGLLEFIPYLGPFLSGTIAFLLTLFQSPVMALWVVILYIVIQFFENHLLVPMIMSKAIGLNPVICILAMLIGSKLGGVIGVIIAIPLAAVLGVFVQDFLELKKEKDNELA